MATPMLHGESTHRSLLRQRIAADRLEPLALPLTPEEARMLIDVKLEDAWLPVAVALLHRLQRLWSIVTSGPGIVARTNQEEHAYLVLRTSFLGTLRQRQNASRSRRTAQSTIPEHLPTSSKLAYLSDEDRARYADAFEQVESTLIELALVIGIPSDPRTVQGVTQHFDDAIDRIEHARGERMLDRALVSGLSSEQIHASKRMNRLLWQRITRQEDYWLAYALQIVARIGEILAMLDSAAEGWHRHDHDEEAYQVYRHLLLRGLDQPESAALHTLATDLLPRILPPGGGLAEVSSIPKNMPNRLERLRSEIISLAAEYGDPIRIDPSTQPELDEVFEEESWAWSNLKVSAVRAERRHPSTLDAPPATRLHRNGRPRAKVTYQHAAELYWQLFDEFGDRPPTQRELSDRLAYIGVPIAPRTLRKRITEWLEEGHSWPPPASDIVDVA